MDTDDTVTIPRRWLKTGLVAVATVLVVAPATAIAGDRFTDVPDTNTFHDDITWLADTGVTKGCNPPDNTEFCPDDNVTRGQMAAFMRRLAENQVVDAGELDGRDGTAYRTLIWHTGCGVNDTFTGTSCGPNDGGLLDPQTIHELLRLDAPVPADGVASIAATILPRDLNAWVTLNEACAQYEPGDQSVIFSQVLNGLYFRGSGTTALNAPSGDHTFRLCVLNNNTDPQTVAIGNLTATWAQGGSVEIIPPPPVAQSQSQTLDP